MSRRLSASLLAAAVALSPIPMIAVATPAAAQVNVGVNVSFDYFYDRLSPYGEWYYHPRWGDVWHPTRVGPDFRPYYRGYWLNTIEYGWTWNSNDPWGGIPYHYGRWVFDPVDGWLWVPGYTWAPAWVVWRGGGNNIGWFPMPPDDRFLAGVEVYRDDWNWDRGYYGYTDWYGPSIATGLLAAWTFVALDHFADRDYYRYAYQRPQVVNIINNTTNVTNYTTVNNRIVNRSIDVAQVERASGRRIERVEARNVVQTPITTVATGSQVRARERERHGGDSRASARDRLVQLPAAEAQVPVRERDARFRREVEQAQRPNAQQQPGGREQQRAQQQERDRNAAQQREERAQRQQQQRERDNRAAIERQQRDQAQRNAAQQREERAQQQQQQRERGAQLQQQREQQNRAAAERQQQQRAQAEQQNRARAEQARRQQEAEQQNRARAEQQQRAQAQRQQRAQAEQQNRARAEQAQRQQQQAAAQQQRQRGKAQQKEEEEKQRRERN